jgi:hypothetical protein
MIVVHDGARNPYRGVVAKDIINAILKEKAGNGNKAKYWDKDEQYERLTAAFNKWSVKGNIWSAAASKVGIYSRIEGEYRSSMSQTHAEQLRHVQKGCLERQNMDIASDGSRIEASHKGWNSLQRSFASGIEVFSALAHDFVLRRNIRVGATASKPTAFAASTFGSHHVHLVNNVAQLWNELVRQRKDPTLEQLPELPDIQSGERFGLVKSRHVETFNGLLEIKNEIADENMKDLLDEIDADEYLQQLDVDPKLRFLPLAETTMIDQEAPQVSRTIGNSRVSHKPLFCLLAEGWGRNLRNSSAACQYVPIALRMLQISGTPSRRASRRARR